jgi:hypothetical protein
MSENLATQNKPDPALIVTRNGPSDFHMIVHVEKWMATIREIIREQQSEPTFRS